MSTLFAFISLLALSLTISAAAATVTEHELDATITALHSNGYNLFGNAIATSDLRYRILSSSIADEDSGDASFTLFSPLDSALFFLDMFSQANAYTQTLYYHVSPNRLTISDLRNLSHLETLVPHLNLSLDYDPQNVTVSVDGVRISDPNLFLGSRIAVHGLEGILVPNALGIDYSPPENDLHPQNSSTLDSDSIFPAIAPSSDSNFSNFESNWTAPVSSPPMALTSSQFPPQSQSSLPPVPDTLSSLPPQNSSPPESLSSQFPAQNPSEPPVIPSHEFSPQCSPPSTLGMIPPQLQSPDFILPPKPSASKELKNNSSRIKNGRRHHGRQRSNRHGHNHHGRFAKFHRHYPDL